MSLQIDSAVSQLANTYPGNVIISLSLHCQNKFWPFHQRNFTCTYFSPLLITRQQVAISHHEQSPFHPTPWHTICRSLSAVLRLSFLFGMRNTVMAPARDMAHSRRNAECNSVQCLSPIAKIGVAMCIVLVTLGGAFTYYWAFIRGRRDEETDSQIDNSSHELSSIRRTSPHQRSPGADDQAIIHRPKPALQSPPAANLQHIMYHAAIPPSIWPPQFILPGPPLFPPAYVMQQQPVLFASQTPLSLSPPPLPPSAPLAAPSGTPRQPGNHSLGFSQHQSSMRPRQPLPGYASTISDFSPARGRSRTPLGSRSQPGSSSSARSGSSSLDTESRAQFEEFVANSGIAEPVNADNGRLPGLSSTANRRTNRRHTLDSHAQGDQSRIGRSRAHWADEPRLATCRIDDTRMSHEHRREYRTCCQPSRPRLLSASFSAGESYVGRHNPEHCVFGEPLPHSPFGGFSRVGESSVRRKHRRHITPKEHRYDPLRITQAQNTRGPSPAQSDVSSTGAICSFEGSDQFLQRPSRDYSSRRHGHTAFRSLSTERGLVRPHRVLSNPESLLSPRSTDSRDLFMTSEEVEAEDDDRHGQHN